jgi:AraC-like DNA-binding protein
MNTACRISFQQQKPSTNLSTIVEEFTFREIVFDSHGTVKKDMPCRHVNSIDFFLAGQYTTFDLGAQETLPFVRSTIRGPRTYRKYSIEIGENFICFSIRFKPTGIFKLLGIPMQEFSDQAIDAMQVMPEFFGKLTDKLLSCNDLKTCVAAAEPILTHQLRKDNSASPHIATLIGLIQSNQASHRLSDLYKEIPLSSRHLERNFIKEVGVSPKTYNSLIRFENVMRAKKSHPEEKWSSIAYDLNYFDQMHLVKDFKKFLGMKPTEFQPNNFAL